MMDGLSALLAAVEQRDQLRTTKKDVKDPHPASPLVLDDPHPFLRQRQVSYRQLYEMPIDNLNWKDQKELHRRFPPSRGLGKRQIPLCLLLDCRSSQDKFKIVNWWRTLSGEDQIQQVYELKTFYKRPLVSNDKMETKTKIKLKNAGIETPFDSRPPKRQKTQEPPSESKPKQSERKDPNSDRSVDVR